MSTPLSPAQLNEYHQILGWLNSMAYVATHTFHHSPDKRAAIYNKVRGLSHEMMMAFGCGDLCTDKEKGCVPCNSV